ncbi:SAM-dependent methyltransferase [Methylosinus sp. LW4]|uniref:SAM-dependent methyltransferase n=1 Tax=Methylosinus sp. LW4 TaxID=136993 RepID=UPI000364E0C8|nr:SAM-dependent methyltransferase [Methylosinus sp. LW4]
MTKAPARARNSHVWERDKFDHYVEPEWIGNALFGALDLPVGTVVLDPSCGWGRLLRGAQTAGLYALGSDIVPRWNDKEAVNFQTVRNDRGVLCLRPSLVQADWFASGDDWCPSTAPGWREPQVVASNPPYDRAEEFLELALTRATMMVVLILPLRWIAGDRRTARLETSPLYKLMPICPRPSMPPGSAIASGTRVEGGKVDFGVFVWLKGYRGAPQIEWLRKPAVARGRRVRSA